MTPDKLAEKIPCGPDADRIVETVKTYVEAGFDRVYLQQIGPDQDAFFQFFERELSGALADVGAKVGRLVGAKN